MDFLVGLPWWLSSKESACHAGNTGDMSAIPGSGSPPWRRKWQPTPVFLLVQFHGQRSLMCYSPGSGEELYMAERLSAHTGRARSCSRDGDTGENHQDGVLAPVWP